MGNPVAVVTNWVRDRLGQNTGKQDETQKKLAAAGLQGNTASGKVSVPVGSGGGAAARPPDTWGSGSSGSPGAKIGGDVNGQPWGDKVPSPAPVYTGPPALGEWPQNPPAPNLAGPTPVPFFAAGDSTSQLMKKQRLTKWRTMRGR